ncbi:hypothetical protein AVEN_30035-1 [Araneus ventricosus]|uniref:Uncharacterized protein n=1 Tax=Araneus ventricosus TaxID=182803 RepID=A0A4Y2I602_ARAVE|nr:hypothetical protein AVEN_30035-1 [Araneus ventricosus]
MNVKFSANRFRGVFDHTLKCEFYAFGVVQGQRRNTCETLRGLKDKFQRLEDCQQSIAVSLLQDEGDESLFETDFDDAEKYRDRFLEVMLHLNLKLTEKVIPIDPPPKRNFKLPQLQLKKLNGDARDYLAFWRQFQKIHADSGIPNEDKMQYLIQVVEEGSKAERLVQSFPTTASNYPKAIQQLQEPFGR